MILVFGWNIAGAAIATVIGNVVGTGYYIVYFMKGSSSLSISLKDFSVKEKVASGVLAIGIPAALGNLLMSLSSILMNSQMAKYGDMAVAGVGVAMKVTMMTGMVEILFLCHTFYSRIRIVGGLHHCRWLFYRAKSRRCGSDRHHLGLSGFRAGRSNRYGAWLVGSNSLYNTERAEGNQKTAGVLFGYNTADADCCRAIDSAPVWHY